MTKSCETCRHGDVQWSKGEAPEFVYKTGEIDRSSYEHAHIICRRYPPAWACDVFRQPSVDERDWCGEHQVEISTRVLPTYAANSTVMMP